MQMLLLVLRSGGSVASAAAASSAAAIPSSLPRLHNNNNRDSIFLPLHHHHHRQLNRFRSSSSQQYHCHPTLSSSFLGSGIGISPSPGLKKNPIAVPNASAPVPPPFYNPDEETERAKLSQVSKRLENTARHFKRLGSLGFWGQLVCTVVAAVILSFSAVVTGKITSPVTFYSTAGGIVAAFVSVFWSFGYIRLSDKLRRTASDPAKAPPRVEVVKSLKNGIVLNLLGMGAAILGMQATVGLLVAKALTTSAIPYYQGASAAAKPVIALDVFLVQASANTILSHFLGLLFSLDLLRSVTLPPSDGIAIPKAA